MITISKHITIWFILSTLRCYTHQPLLLINLVLHLLFEIAALSIMGDFKDQVQYWINEQYQLGVAVTGSAEYRRPGAIRIPSGHDVEY